MLAAGTDRAGCIALRTLYFDIAQDGGAVEYTFLFDSQCHLPDRTCSARVVTNRHDKAAAAKPRYDGGSPGWHGASHSNTACYIQQH